MAEEFPYKIETAPDEENEIIKKDFRGYLSGAVRVQPKGYFFQGIYRDYANQVYNFPVRSTDVFVASYPKCGTTWTQEMVWLLVHDFDYEGAKVELDKRFPFVEADHVLDRRVFELPGICEKLKCPPPEPGERLAMASELPNPRTIKTHMPFSLLPPKLLDTLMYSPFMNHFQEAWERRHHKNLLILTYEQLKTDLTTVIRRVATFLGKTVSNENVETLASHLHFDAMKNNPAVNAVADAATGLLDLQEGGFVRKGKSGGYQEYFDDEMREKFNMWLKEKGHGLEKEFNWS